MAEDIQHVVSQSSPALVVLYMAQIVLCIVSYSDMSTSGILLACAAMVWYGGTLRPNLQALQEECSGTQAADTCVECPASLASPASPASEC